MENRFELLPEETDKIASVLNGNHRLSDIVNVVESILSERWVSDDEIWKQSIMNDMELKDNGWNPKNRDMMRSWFEIGTQWMRSRIFKTDEK